MPFADSVIDLSHFNQHLDFDKAKTDQISGVFHKATQGTSFFDPTYAEHCALASKAGLLWGAYHFGTGADGLEQAEFFLEKVQPGRATLLALDLEANPQGPSMTLEEARAFVTHIQAVTGRWPGLYAGAYLKQLLGVTTDPVLGKCWFWLSQYGPTPVIPPNWKNWTLWQYTDGAAGPGACPVDGIGRCDRSKFNGSQADLIAFWNAGAVRLDLPLSVSATAGPTT